MSPVWSKALDQYEMASLNTWTDPVRVEVWFLVDDFEQFGDTETAANLWVCGKHSKFEATRMEVVELQNRTLGREPRRLPSTVERCHTGGNLTPRRSLPST